MAPKTLSKVIPTGLQRRIDKQFVIPYTYVPKSKVQDMPAFDMVRASVNLMVASDNRPDADKEKLLVAVWEKATAMLPKNRIKDILRDLRSPEGLLSINFPTHKRQVMVCLLNSACDAFVPKEEFLQKAQEALVIAWNHLG